METGTHITSERTTRNGMMAIVHAIKIGMVTLSVMLASCDLRYSKVYSGAELPREKLASIVGDVHLSESLEGLDPFPQLCLDPLSKVLISCQVSLGDIYRSTLREREWIAVSHVDEQDLAELPARIQVLPGQRTIRVILRRDGVPVLGAPQRFPEIANQSLELNAKAGHTYRIRFQREPDNAGGPATHGLFIQATKINNWIEDAETGEVVSGTKPAP